MRRQDGSARAHLEGVAIDDSSGARCMTRVGSVGRCGSPGPALGGRSRVVRASPRPAWRRAGDAVRSGCRAAPRMAAGPGFGKGASQVASRAAPRCSSPRRSVCRWADQQTGSREEREAAGSSHTGPRQANEADAGVALSAARSGEIMRRFLQPLPGSMGSRPPRRCESHLTSTDGVNARCLV